MIDHEIKDAIRKSWDLSSVMYDNCPGHGIGTDEEKFVWKQELSRNLPESPQKVLDVGCGTGVMGLLFAEMGHQVTGNRSFGRDDGKSMRESVCTKTSG